MLELRTQGADTVDERTRRQGVEQMERGDSEMIDREKVMKGLTAIQDEAYDRLAHRQYIKDPLITLIRDNISDALALLREQEPVIVRCKDCLHYHYGAKVRSGTVIQGVGFCGLLERVFLETDYCSYHTGAK